MHGAELYPDLSRRQMQERDIDYFCRRQISAVCSSHSFASHPSVPFNIDIMRRHLAFEHFYIVV